MAMPSRPFSAWTCCHLTGQCDQKPTLRGRMPGHLTRLKRVRWNGYRRLDIEVGGPSARSGADDAPTYADFQPWRGRVAWSRRVGVRITSHPAGLQHRLVP